MRKIYISSHDAPEAERLAAKLRDAGHTVVSTWHLDHSPKVSASDGAWWSERREDNHDQIAEADNLVLMSGPDKYSGGKFFEAGIAHASGIPVVVLGHYENGMVSGFPVVQDSDGLIELLA